MTTTDKLMEILNQDEKAKQLLGAYKKALEQYGKDFTEKEKAATHEFIMRLAILGNKDAMDAMSESLYEDLRNE